MSRVEKFLSFIDGSNDPLVVVSGDSGVDTLVDVLHTSLVAALMAGTKKIRERDGAIITWDVLSTSPLGSMPTNLEVGNPDMEDGEFARPAKYTVPNCPNPSCPIPRSDMLHTRVQREACIKAGEKELETRTEFDLGGGD